MVCLFLFFFYHCICFILTFPPSPNACQVKNTCESFVRLLFLLEIETPKPNTFCGWIITLLHPTQNKKPHTLEIATQKVNSHFYSVSLSRAHNSFITRSIPEFTQTHTHTITVSRSRYTNMPGKVNVALYHGLNTPMRRNMFGWTNIGEIECVFVFSFFFLWSIISRSMCMCLSLSACCFLLLSNKNKICVRMACEEKPQDSL